MISVTPEQVCGEKECFGTDTIEWVQRRDFSPSETADAAVHAVTQTVRAVVAVVAVAAVIAFMVLIQGGGAYHR